MVGFFVSDGMGTTLFQALPEFGPFIKPGMAETFRFEVQLPPLIPGEYLLTAWAGPHGETSLMRAGSLQGAAIALARTISGDAVRSSLALATVRR